jgi:hypothetical protein
MATFGCEHKFNWLCFVIFFSRPLLGFAHIFYLMPERFDGQMGFGNAGANASKMRM